MGISSWLLSLISSFGSDTHKVKDPFQIIIEDLRQLDCDLIVKRVYFPTSQFVSVTTRFKSLNDLTTSLNNARTLMLTGSVIHSRSIFSEDDTLYQKSLHMFLYEVLGDRKVLKCSLESFINNSIALIDLIISVNMKGIEDDVENRNVNTLVDLLTDVKEVISVLEKIC